MTKVSQTNISMPEERRLLYARLMTLLYPRTVKRNERRYVLTGKLSQSLDEAARAVVEICEKKHYRKFSDDEGRIIFGGELWAHLHRDEWNMEV